jgi:glycosyltransferase involved in cell wall biosynthesis
MPSSSSQPESLNPPDSETENPAVSILIATYNSSATIERTLHSIRAQSFTDFQCVVADDCSGDDTLDLVESFSQSDPRFRVTRNSQNLGWIGNVNQVLGSVDTEFFYGNASR